MTNALTINITAADRATRVIQNLNKNFDRTLRPIRNMQRSMQQLGRAVGLDTVKKKLEGLTQTARDVAGAFARIGAPLMALVGGGTIAGLVALTNGWARLGLQLSQTSQILGVNTQDLYNLQNAARLVGISGEGATQTFSAFADTLQDAFFGRNQQAAGLLYGLHIGLKKTKTGSIDAMDALGQVADQVQRMQRQGNTGGARTLASQFGLTSFLPLLAQGRKGIEALEAQAQKRTGVMDWKKIADAGAAWNGLKVSMDGVKNTIASALLPTISPLVDKFGAWITANRNLIATDIGDFVKGLGNVFKGLTLKDVLDKTLGIVQAMVSLAGDIAGVTDALGGMKTVLEGLAVLWAAPKILSFGAAFLKASVYIDGARTSLLAWRAASLAEDGATMATRAATVASGGLRGASIGARAIPVVSTGIALGAAFDELFPNNWLAQLGRFSAGKFANYEDKFASGHKAQSVMSFFQRQGWTKAQAAGITANIQRESNFDPNAIGDNGQARGIAQWHAPRQAAFNTWAEKNRMPSLAHAGFAEQLQFYNYELRNSEAGKRLSGATNADEAGRIVSLYDERPAGGQTEAARRGGLAASIAAGDAPPINLSVQTTVQRDGATTTKVQTPSGVKIVHTNPADSVS